MDSFYDATIFIGVGLTSVVGAVYVVATTFLGRALQDARKASEESAQRALEAYAQAKQVVQDSETLAEGFGALFWLRVREGRRRARSFIKDLNSGPQLLGVWHAVMLPGFFFLVSVGLTAAAKSGTLSVPSSTLWSAGLVFLALGMWRLTSVFLAVQKIGAKSEEAQMQTQLGALKRALIEVEEERQPWFTLETVGETPIEFTTSESKPLEFYCRVSRAPSAANVDVILWVPAAFSAERSYIDNVGSFEGWRRVNMLTNHHMRSGYRHPCGATVTAPNEPGTHQFAYKFISDLASSDPRTFEVHVTEPNAAEVPDSN